MSSVVEGDWNEFSFKMISSENYPAVLDHLRNNFFKDEPMNRHLGDGVQKTNDLDKIGIIYMDQGISFMAIHKQTGKVAGVRVMAIVKKDEDNTDELMAILESQEVKDLLPVLLEMSEEANIFERLGVDAYADFLYLSVDRNFRNQGLASEIYKRAIKLLQTKGISVAKSIFTNPYSQKIARNLEFVEITKRYFKDYKASDGRQIMPNARDDEVGILMLKKF